MTAPRRLLTTSDIADMVEQLTEDEAEELLDSGGGDMHTFNYDKYLEIVARRGRAGADVLEGNSNDT